MLLPSDRDSGDVGEPTSLIDRRAKGLPPVRRIYLGACRVGELAYPTLTPGETYTDLLADRSAFEDFDVDAAGEPGYGFIRLNQLAIEHLLRAR